MTTTPPDNAGLARRLYAAIHVESAAISPRTTALIEAAREAAETLDALRPSVWMDISTAPKDGTLVQLWGKYWSDGQGMMKEPLVGNWMHERWEVWGPGGRFGIRPTHWTNLPTPPKAPTP